MKTQSLIILTIMPLILACSRLDDPTNTEFTDEDFTVVDNNQSACEIPNDLLPENADSSSLQMSIKINDEDFYFDGTPTNTNGVFSFIVDDLITDNDLGVFFDINASNDFSNRDASISGALTIRNDSNETQNFDIELKIPVISDGTISTSYSGNISMILSSGEIQSIDNQNLWSMFASCNQFSLAALSLEDSLTAGEDQSITIGSYAFGGGNSANLDGPNIMKEMGFRVRFKLSAGASVSLSSFLGAHRELAP